MPAHMVNEMEESTRARLLCAAGEAFSEHGFERATIRQICKNADVNLASVNYYFGDKERLYVETIKYAHRLREAQSPLPRWPEGTSAEQRLRDFVRVTVDRMLVATELPWQARLMMREMLQPTGACRELAEDYFRPHFKILHGILSELIPENTPSHIRNQLAFGIIAQCLFYKHNQFVIEMLIPDGEFEKHYAPSQLADRISDFLLASVGKLDLFADQRNNQTTEKNLSIENGPFAAKTMVSKES